MHQISSQFPASFHRVTIKGLCVQDSKLLLVKESNALSGGWELPGGGLDFGEDIHQALKREVKEEMGLSVARISKSPLYVWTHRYEKTRGLEWFYSFVVAFRVEFKDLHFTPTEECEAIQFFSKNELAEMTLTAQTKGLLTQFDPADFVTPF